MEEKKTVKKTATRRRKNTKSGITVPKNFTKKVVNSLVNPKKPESQQYSVHIKDEAVNDYIADLAKKTSKKKGKKVSEGAVVSQLVTDLVHAILEEK